MAINLSTLVNSSVASQIANAWVNFSGSTINSSYGVSSVTVNAAGDYTVGLSLTDANYCAVATPSCSPTSANLVLSVTLDQTGGGTYQARTSTALRMTVRYGSTNGLYAPYNVNVVIFGV